VSLLLGAGLQAPSGADAIVGGRTVSHAAAPWFATLPGCGGTLIAPDRVATAAHCVAGLNLRDPGAIRLGDGRARAAARVAVHPGYVRRSRAGTQDSDAPIDDVALVQLAAPVTGIEPLDIARAVRGDRIQLLGRGLTRPPSASAHAAQSGQGALRAATVRGVATTRAGGSSAVTAVGASGSASMPPAWSAPATRDSAVTAHPHASSTAAARPSCVAGAASALRA